jgi:GH24 family phage-related lysozyme (muramidase)
MNRDNVRKQLEIDEGVVYEIYEDHLGYKTFGIGHLVRDLDLEMNWPVGTEVSRDRVASAFEKDFDVAVRECAYLYDMWETFPDEIQEVLVNMLFNLGRPRLSKFKNFKKALDAHDWKQAGIEGRDSAWYRQVTNRAERLMVRVENV